MWCNGNMLGCLPGAEGSIPFFTANSPKNKP